MELTEALKFASAKLLESSLATFADLISGFVVLECV